jgi:UDP-N-acetylmuramoylalanine--D-glutamate ligase
MTIDKLATQGRTIYSTLAGRQYSEVSRLRNETLKSMFASKENAKHKRQVVANIKGVNYIDDSKSINPNATWFTFETIGNPIIWILEIEDKNENFVSLANSVKEKVHTLIAVGGNDNKISKAFNGLTNLIQVNNLSEAVKMAYYFANEPDVVVYSPANGSEENIENNANRFLQLVNEL